jgi:hypothetical protein
MSFHAMPDKATQPKKHQWKKAEIPSFEEYCNQELHKTQKHKRQAQLGKVTPICYICN